MNRQGRAMLPERTEQRERMRLYMQRWRAGRIVRRVAQPRILRPHFSRPGHCDNCGHRWDSGPRCPLCCLESGMHHVGHFHVRRLIAWSQLMEALAA